jgi:hypothetical protein
MTAGGQGGESVVDLVKKGFTPQKRPLNEGDEVEDDCQN